jgi:hypothetical protein
LRPPAKNLAIFRFRPLPAFAAAKGQEKGNVPNHDF